MGKEDKDEDIIDLNKLSQRELLILLHNDVKDLKKEMKDVADLKLKVNTLETKSKFWGGVVGFFTGLASGIMGGMASR